jgi:hypothetical protein
VTDDSIVEEVADAIVADVVVGGVAAVLVYICAGIVLAGCDLEG